MGKETAGTSRRTSRLFAALVVPLVVGAVVVLTPFWLSIRSDPEPLGAACWFEHDPGSGRSAVGVERVDWGPAPQRVCTPIGPANLPTSGPEFDAAVERSALDVDGEALRTFPLLGAVWPLAIIAVASFIWVLMLLVASQISADRQTMRAVGRHSE